MVDEVSLCPINWSEYQDKVDEALGIIYDSGLDEDTKEKIRELIEVDRICGYPDPGPATGCLVAGNVTWADTLNYVDALAPSTASIPEVDWLHAQVRKLVDGTALESNHTAILNS